MNDLSKHIIIKCPKCGYEYLASEIFYPEDLLGTCNNIIRDENGKILSWNNPLTAKIRSKTYPGIAKAMAEQWTKEV